MTIPPCGTNRKPEDNKFHGPAFSSPPSSLLPRCWQDDFCDRSIRQVRRLLNGQICDSKRQPLTEPVFAYLFLNAYKNSKPTMPFQSRVATAEKLGVKSHSTRMISALVWLRSSI